MLDTGAGGFGRWMPRGHRHDGLDPVADEPHADRQRHDKPVANARRPRNANANWPTHITIDAETGNHP
jgi:hypothetical protein